MDRQPETSELERLQDELLLATLPNIVFDGWSEAALRDGARQAGIDSIDAHRAFPGGARDLAQYFCAWTDRQMRALMDEAGLEEMRVGERVALALRCHFQALAPHLEAKRRLLAWLTLPANVPLGFRLLYRTTDAIWFAVGDTATDFSHYTKRATLAGVLSAATFYWLDDRSDDQRDTAAFIDRRLADVVGIAKSASKLRGAGGLLWRLPSPARFTRLARRRAGIPRGTDRA